MESVLASVYLPTGASPGTSGANILPFFSLPADGPTRRSPANAQDRSAWRVLPSDGDREQEANMFGRKQPTRIDLGSNDAAIVVRANGEMEMFIRQAKGDEDLPPGQAVLALFGMAFHDQRVRTLLAQIVKEKNN